MRFMKLALAAAVNESWKRNTHQRTSSAKVGQHPRREVDDVVDHLSRRFRADDFNDGADHVEHHHDLRSTCI